MCESLTGWIVVTEELAQGNGFYDGSLSQTTEFL